MSDNATPFKRNIGRPPNPVRKDDWHVSVEQDLSLYFRMKFHDELTGTTRKNAMSSLVNRLLREEMNRLQGKGTA